MAGLATVQTMNAQTVLQVVQLVLAQALPSASLVKSPFSKIWIQRPVLIIFVQTVNILMGLFRMLVFDVNPNA